MNNPIQWHPLQSPGSAWPPHPASPATCAVPVAPAPPPSLPPSSDKHGSEDTEPEPGHRPEGPGQAGPGCPEAHAGQSCLLRVKDRRLLRYLLSPSPAETGTTGAVQHQNTKGRLCQALYTSRKGTFSPWGNVIFYPKGTSPPAASSFPALKVGGIGETGQYCSPLTPPISITVCYIFPDLSLLGFWGTALPWHSQVLFGEGGSWQVSSTLVSFLSLVPYPKASQIPKPLLLVTLSTAPHCSKPRGTNCSFTSSHIRLPTPPHPLLFSRADNNSLWLPTFQGYTLLPPADSYSCCSSLTEAAFLLVIIRSHPRALAESSILMLPTDASDLTSPDTSGTQCLEGLHPSQDNAESCYPPPAHPFRSVLYSQGDACFPHSPQNTPASMAWGV